MASTDTQRQAKGTFGQSGVFDAGTDMFSSGTGVIDAFAAPVAPAFVTAAVVSSASAASGTSAGGITTLKSSVSGTVSGTSLPTWIASIATASIATDMAAAVINGAVTYSGLSKLFSDLAVTLTNTKTTLTSSEFADLKTIVANLNTGVSSSAYLTAIAGALVNGSGLNKTWTGGATSSVTLGNLAAGSSATQLTELVGKWFLGTDLPNAQVLMSGASSFTVNYSTTTKALYGTSGPTMSDINQGYLGDCYLLSSLAEVASHNPSAITSMISDNGNGTYGVRFYVNGQAQYVTVNAQFANGGTIFNSGSNAWASLVEKAYAQLQTNGAVTGNSAVNYGNAWSTIGNGGVPLYALEQVTGASQLTYFAANGSSWNVYTLNASLATTGYSASQSSTSVLNTLISDLSKGYDLILSSNTNAKDSAGKQTLVADHAMSIYGYDSATAMLQVRNPWGSENGQYWDTTFEVSLSTLLAAGDSISVDNLSTQSVKTPTPPVVANQTAAQTWKLGSTVNFTLPANTFSDPQGQALTYTAMLSTGAALPSWLKFNAATGTFSGTVPNTAAGLAIKVTATDTSGLSVSETFNVTTPASAPVLASQTAAQTWKLGSTVNFALPANTFSDPQGEALTYTATLSNGTALPTWLKFNAATGTFSGTVPNTAAGLAIKVTATDTSGLSVSETFNVTTPASAPVLASQTAAQTWKLGSTVNFALPTETFRDPQGQALSYSATLSNGTALPTWLKFNAATGTFSGTVPNTAAGLSIKVTATDTSGLSVSETFNVTTPASAPVLNTQTANQTWKTGSAVSLALPTTTFKDPQAETLSYTATQTNGSALPSWLKFNAATETFTGMAPTAASSVAIKVTATDTSGLSVSETFTATITAAANALVHAISALPATTSVSSALSSALSSSQTTLAIPVHA